jgi:hypothetical protein
MTRQISRPRDMRTEVQMREVEREAGEIDSHASTHKLTGSDPLSASDIGAETPAGAATKVTTHETAYHSGGTTADRPASPNLYALYFDTTLGKPVWYDGSEWVDATGTIV